ncbi:Brefeldin A resistance protein [Porphyridium purpureum]|uniref:Probable ATP-dependent transporter ycf16 n=1 Tax=Porphyridium purpureum TaxID=35688 RepID=A0A5J4YUE0_PORPP|nr:Brefeldin A resistance protein [Porphyridium purpureum]|eukprot:POR1649..scf227_4
MAAARGGCRPSELVPARMRHFGPEEYWRRKHAVEEAYGEFWKEDPTLDPRSEQFDRLKFMDFYRQILDEVGLPMGGVAVALDDVSVSVPILVEKNGHDGGPTVLEAARGGAVGPFKKMSQFLDRLIKRRRGRIEKQDRKVLDGVSAYMRESEMLLIVGPPGCGGSTLLQLMSMRGVYFSGREGKVLYNGLDVYDDAKDMIMPLQHTVRLVQQEDVHLAPLTVLDTLGFAGACLTPPILPYADFVRNMRIGSIAMSLGIDRVFSTPVGDENIRGCSGGEKKRVTIGEMLVGHIAKVVLLDSFNKGLDAAATLDITLTIKTVASKMGFGVAAIVQQPSEGVFNAFDRVLVLDQGKPIFFGRPSEAQGYFEGLGFKKPPLRSVPDFVCTVSDATMFDELVPQENVDKVPRSVDEFVDRYRKSQFYEDCRAEIEKGVIGSHPMIHSDYKSKIDPEAIAFLNNECLNSKMRQFSLLMARNIRLEFLDRKTNIAHFVLSALIGLVLGTLFLGTESNQAGAYSRNGLLFVVLVYNALSGMSSVGKKYALKNVYLKQHASRFYEPGPFVASAILVDAILSFIRVILFGVCVYWLADLNPAAGRFFIFLLINWLGNLVVDSFIRLFTTLMDIDSATGLVGLGLLACIIFAGFLIPNSEIGGWYVWIYWISPLQYMYGALAINEFYGRDLFCTPSELMPPDPSIATQFKTCPFTTGEQYATVRLGVRQGFEWVWYNIAIIVGYWVLFLVLAVICTYTLKPKEFKAKRLLNDSEIADETEMVDVVSETLHSQAQLKFKKEAETRDPSEQKKFAPAYIVWRDLSYTVPVGKGETKQLLDKIDGFCRPGRMIALMGSSGAGKTTLMDVVAKRKTLGVIEGDILINHAPQDDFFPRYTGYVEQMDVHYGKMTVRESLEFSARLRLPERVPEEEKQAIVEQTLDVLLLRDRQDERVGTPGVDGLPAEARKRLTMGVELVARPSILFLDEPTSGLDSRAALLCTQVMRNIANLGCSVICTIHQPSIEIFNQFDELLLLQRGGQTVYFGELGENSQTLVDYFTRNGAEPMEPGQNPADYMLLQIGAGLGRKKVDQQNWHEVWKSSPECAEIARLTHEPEGGLVPKDVQPFTFSGFRASSRGYQLKHVLKRLVIMRARSPEYILVRFIVCFFQAVLLGFLFFQLDDDQTGVSLMPAALFMSALAGSMQIANVIGPIVNGRPVYYRELAAGMYGVSAAWLSNVLAEIPSAILAALLFQSIFYWTIGFRASTYGYFFLANEFFMLWCIAIGQAVAVLAPNFAVAQAFPPLINTIGNCLAGFLIQKREIPGWWIWVYYINPFAYYLNGILDNELTGQTFVCDPVTQNVPFLNPQPGTSCTALDNADFSYVNLGSAPTFEPCGFCAITSGDNIKEPYSVGVWNKWINIGALVGFWFFFIFLHGFGLKFVKHQSR